MTQSTTLEDLLKYNQRRCNRFQDSELFGVTKSGLGDPKERDVFLACIQRFSTNFQSVLLTRQALCTDETYAKVFREHLAEEIDHDKLLTEREGAREIQDPIFEGLCVWFTHQMVVLDNAEKTALVHLVLEAAGDLFHHVAAGTLQQHVKTGYFELHSELDEGHAELGVDLLKGLTERVYRRLHDVVRMGWDVLEAAGNRVVELVRQR